MVVGVAESATLNRCTSAAARAAEGARTGTSASAARTANRKRNNGTSVELGAACRMAAARALGRDPVEARQHSQQSLALQPLGAWDAPAPLDIPGSRAYVEAT